VIRTDEHGDGLQRLLLVLVVVQVQLHHDFLHVHGHGIRLVSLVIRFLYRLRKDERNAMHGDEEEEGWLTFDMSRRGAGERPSAGFESRAGRREAQGNSGVGGAGRR
jgi:hypothetical protein